MLVRVVLLLARLVGVRVGVRHGAVAVLVLVLGVLVLVRDVGVGVGDVAVTMRVGMRPVVLVLAHRLPPVRSREL
jgi:hypothetical protein